MANFKSRSPATHCTGGSNRYLSHSISEKADCVKPHIFIGHLKNGGWRSYSLGCKAAMEAARRAFNAEKSSDDFRVRKLKQAFKNAKNGKTFCFFGKTHKASKKFNEKVEMNLDNLCRLFFKFIIKV